jgi:bifunctional aspartokinase / homoserine dehydrogenase 1
VKKGIKFYFETNVGAGLPILSTINDLINSGDQIVEIQAVLSGTLNFIFNVISKEIPLSKAIKMAINEGFSEPDPRIDLSGKDVVRKLLILSREAGYELEEEHVKVENFIPAELMKNSIEIFFERIKELDNEFEMKRRKLENENKKWRYIASFNQKGATISLKAIDQHSPFYDLEGSNNIILITTERYNKFPLQIKGYGAGADVTAAGVFSDIIRIANI